MCLALLTALSCAENPSRPEPRCAERGRLQPGASLQSEITDATCHSYELNLDGGTFVRAVLAQEGLDLAMRWIGPRGDLVLEIDHPSGSEGDETLSVVTAATGKHRLEIVAATVDSASAYQLSLAALRPAEGLDLDEAKAMQIYAKAEALRIAGESDALSSYQQAYDLWLQLDIPLELGRTARRIGTLLNKSGEARQALNYFEEALAIYPSYAVPIENLALLNDAGAAFQAAGRVDRAFQCFSAAAEIARQLDHSRALANSLSNLATVYDYRGEPRSALSLHREALELRQRIGDGYGEAVSLHNIGLAYATLGRHEDGILFLKRAAQRYRERGDGRAEGATINAIGWTHLQRRDHDAALAAFDSALDLRRDADDANGEAITLDAMGAALFAVGRLDEAQHAHLQAHETFVAHNLLPSLAINLANLGAVHQAKGQLDDAIRLYRTAFEHFSELEDLHNRASTRVAMASIARLHGDLDRARQLLEAALETTESLRGRLQIGAFRTSFLSTRHDVYAAYIDLLMQLDSLRPEERFADLAFDAAERARARSLLDGLAETLTASKLGPFAEGGRAVDPALLRREKDLRQQINAKERLRAALLDSPATTEQAKQLDDELRTLLVAYDELQGDIRTASEMDVDPTPLSSASIRDDVLDDDSLLLAYSLGEDRSFLWALDRNRLDVFELPPRSEIEPLAKMVHAVLSRRNQRGLRQQADLAKRALTEMILSPVAEHLQYQRLLIVGDGALRYVPFTALPKPGLEHEPLLSDHEIVELPSASAIALLRQRSPARQAANKELAIFADPVFDAEALPFAIEPGAAREVRPGPQLDQTRSALDLGQRRFDPLPYSREEARAIMELVPETSRFVALGHEARLETLQTVRLDEYRILHFATHSVLNTRHPSLSSIVLSTVSPTGEPQDGLLRLHEIRELELAADLVVLSACRTALGQEVRGEGVLGLASGLFLAGAQRVVVSLWNVNDQATSILMTGFYRAMLEEGMPPAAALRQAQLSLASSDLWSAPYYWAAFSLHGEWQPPHDLRN